MLEQIFEIITEINGHEADEYTENSNLVTDMELSSFDIVQLIAAIEERFDIRVPTRDLIGFTTPKRIVEYIQGAGK